GTKAKNATSCGNAFVTNILLASRLRKASRNGNQFLRSAKKCHFSLREKWHFWVISHPLFFHT
ncbi:hypothetical protein ABHM95_15640, partial [Solibacillus isronensis]|uniref:hypothetical protein n=1 Tax=Solibacillus isronensis TaxID=412383 RepID=UPI003D27F900